jgi:threonylcarbamoyladenosine tRNA methylthiotransferase MtaB
MGVDVITFGCRLNTYESELMRLRAGEAGLEDALLFNTCAVTGEAVRQARQSIRRARREQPGRPIVVTGCAAQIEPATFAAMPEVDLVLGNAEKLTVGAYRALPNFGSATANRVRVNDIMSVRETAVHLIDGVDGHVRAFIQVQNGCDHRCTFCIIPYGRGSSRSVPMGVLVDQVRRLVGHGVQEVVLTGVDITSYGADLPGRPRLGGLVRSVLKHVPGLARLRLSSIDCVEADAELMRALAEEDRLMPHLHLSLQAGDDLILKRMKRRHLRGDAIRFCDEVRRLRPDIALGADLIAGFPTETEAQFDNTLSAIEACGLAFLHIFPYSPRAGTPAARMPQLPRPVVKQRAARLREVGSVALARRLSADIGQTRSALVERPGFGRTEHFAPVTFDGGQRGQVRTVLIEDATKDILLGTIVQEAA